MTQETKTTKIVQTEITDVTVYTTRALVTRRGTVLLDGSENELVVAGLPNTLLSESVRASGIGTMAVKLLGVRTEYKYYTEPVGEKAADLTRQIEELELKIRVQQDLINSLNLQRKFVESLSEKSVEEFSSGLSRKRVGLDETRELLGFLGTQYKDYSSEIIQKQEEVKESNKELTRLRNELQRIITPRPKESYSFMVGIEASGEGEFELEVSYVVNAANWSPLYDLRVNKGGDKVGLSYLAEVTQSSGEDWKGVTLTLSTAKPGLGTLPPKLDPWYLDMFRPRPPMQAAGGFAMMAAPAPAPQAAQDMVRSKSLRSRQESTESDTGTMNFQLLEAENVSAEVSSEGGVVTFRVDRDSDIPSDGAPHKITIFNDDFPSRTEFIAVPRLVSFAYLQATIKNPSGGATLLPGQANVFRENTFVGTTQLENVAPGQEFKLNLGIDESLKIERDMVEREVDKRFIGNQRRITFGYRLIVTNLQDHDVNLKLTEQIPVSRNEQIKVKLNRINPPIQPGEMGALEWVLPIAPKAKRELYYQFTVEHPTDLNITGLNI